MDPRALRNPENMYPFLYDQYYLLIFLNFFFDVWSSSISSIVRAWVSIIEWFCKGESLGNGKSTERFVKKIDKNSILLFIRSFSTTYHTCLNWNFTFCVTVQTKSGKLLSGAWKKG